MKESVRLDGRGRILAHAAAGSTVKNDGTGTCWTSLGATNNGAPAELYGCNGSAANQQWSVITYSGNSGYYFKNAGDAKCLNNTNGSLSNDNQQEMWDCYYGVNEGYILANNNSMYQLYTDDGVNGYCLSSLGNSGNNAPLDEYGCNYGSNQSWTSPIL